AMLAWCFLVGGYTARVLDATSGATALLTGSVTGVTLATLALVGCNRFGCDSTDISKPCLGQRGAKVILGVHLVCQLAWAGLVLCMFGRGAQTLLQTSGIAAGAPTVRGVMALGLLGIYLLVAFRGRGVALLTRAATPGVLTLAALVFYVIFRDVSFAELTRIPPVVDVTLGPNADLAAFAYGLGTGLCWWPALADLLRNGRSVRAAVYPQILTMGLFSGAMATLGLWAALLFRSFDPNDWLQHMGGGTFGHLTLCCLGCTHLAGASACLSGIAHSLRHVRRLRQLKWQTLAALPCVPLLACLMAPEYIYGHGQVLLVLIAYALMPVAGVMAVDYLVLRRQRINLSQLYDDSRHAVYWYWGGVNWVTLGCIALGTAVSLVGFNPVTHAAHPFLRILGGSPLGTLVAVALHSVFVRSFLRRRGVGGYRAPTAPQAILHVNL
ncbi:MAG: hypothetical protein EOO40_06170, partial [Deltaproteobacteria bacterium]